MSNVFCRIPNSHKLPGKAPENSRYKLHEPVCLDILDFWLMQILFAISAVCFLALVWAGISVTRHIRKGHQLDAAASSSHDSFAQHLQASIAGDLPISRRTPNQSIHDITARKSWNQQPEVITMRPSPELRSERAPNTAESLQDKHRSPQASHQSGDERLDWAYFNKD